MCESSESEMGSDLSNKERLRLKISERRDLRTSGATQTKELSPNYNNTTIPAFQVVYGEKKRIKP